VLLDGFDLGIGVLFGTTRDQNYRGQILTAIAPFWDGNDLHRRSVLDLPRQGA
jgi:cytochrome d ubiquinol oxidase subunit II